ncbi:MAG TPA: Ig-like domain repeat protein, partial [Acidimicrobiia bacterium]|nr:Ig-like domain repeat protein [Acidimicrobiia bacterium]
DVNHKGGLTKTLTFLPGRVARDVAVTVYSDTVAEPTETFTVTLSNPSAGYTIGDGVGVGTIVDDDVDAANRLSVGDASIHEGDVTKRIVKFRVALSQQAAAQVTVDYRIVPVSATGNYKSGALPPGTDVRDMFGETKTLVFKPALASGLTPVQKIVSAIVFPDTVAEGDETFEIRLSNLTGPAVLADAIGVGTIIEDDGSPVQSTTTTVGADDTTPVAGQPVQLTATVGAASGTPTGTVEFFDGAASLGSVALVAGSGQISTSTLAVGPHAITAQYSGDGAYAPSGSNSVTVTVAAAPTVQTASFRLGPFVLAPEGSPGSQSESTQSNIPKPTGAFGIVGMRFDVIHGDGTSEGHHNVHLHHTVFMDSSRPDSLCSGLPNRFAGAGAERTPVSFGTDYAYKVGATDQWSALWHIMNMSTATHTVYIEYEIDYVTGADLAAAKPLTSYFYDVDNCWGDSEYNVPGGGGVGSIHSKSISYTAPRNGVRLFTGGHLHDGGIDLILTQNGTEVCRPTAVYMDGMLHEITYCTTPTNVTAGTAIQLTARYSNENAIAGAMGISISYVWEP